MGRALLVAYYVVSYSVGVASLIYALILRLGGKEPLLGRFIACTAVMTAIVLSGSLLNAYGGGIGVRPQAALRLLNLSLAAIYAYLLVAFAAEAFPFPGDRAARLLALLLSAIGLCLAAGDLAFRDRKWIGFATLMIKDAAILGAIAAALLPRGGSSPRTEGSYQSFFRIVSIATLFIMPFMLWEEIGGFLGSFPIEVEGPLSLPAIYGIWSAAFIVARLRSARAPGGAAAGGPAVAAAGASPGPGFLARYGITAREGEILGLLVRGLSYKRIMSDLDISMPTVKTHVSSLYRKTGTANRLELANLVQKNEAPSS